MTTPSDNKAYGPLPGHATCKTCGATAKLDNQDGVKLLPDGFEFWETKKVGAPDAFCATCVPAAREKERHLYGLDAHEALARPPVRDTALEPGEARFWAWYPLDDHPYFLLVHALIDAEGGEVVTLGKVIDIEDGEELDPGEWEAETYEEFEKNLLAVATDAGHASWDGWAFLKSVAFPRRKEGLARG